MIKRALAILAASAATALLLAPAALAVDEPFGVNNFDLTFNDELGGSLTQAGSHPYEMRVSFGLNTKDRTGGGLNVSEPLKDLEVTQIAGLVGNPTAVPPCATADFLNPRENAESINTASCPDSSAVGLVSAESITTGIINPAIWTSVFNLDPPPGTAAKLGFWTGGVPVTIELGVNETPPYNIVGGPTNVSQILEVTGSELIIWGVPADPSHDPYRGFCGGGTGPVPVSLGDCPANIDEEPFLTLPRACEGPLATTYRARSWEDEGAFSDAGSVLTHDSSVPPVPQGMTGCAKLGFAPAAALTPTSSQAESAAGLEVAIDVKDDGIHNPDGYADADIAATRFALPAGVTLNPSAAEGLGVCTLAQFQAASLANQSCPPASKLGSLEVDTPILENRTLRGSFYLAAQRENPFGSMFAAYLMIRDDELGVFVKLPARIETDPISGQIVTTVIDMPPFPLERVRVNLRQGPRAPLITPPACGAYSSAAVLTPSSGAPPQPSTSSFQITSGPGGGPCPPPGPPPFSPGFEAGSISNAAGEHSPFYMRLTRADGEADLTRFSAVLPPGVTGKIAGLERCPDAALAAAPARSGRAELAAPSCPEGSRVGSVLAGAGVGTALTYVPGSVYLAGPYKGAPLSVAAVVPAVAGPFDVGTIVTRVGLRLNPESGEVEVDGGASDPIPHILEGIPLKVRDIRVFADRPGFTLNPTSCAPSQAEAQIFGSGANPFDPADDVAVARSARYQAASCASLQFKPKLSLQLKGSPKRSKNTAFSAVLTPRSGDANLAGAIVTLPPSQFIDNAHINNPCTREQFATGACPASSILGRARAFTPLLDNPLEGPVYFRSNGGVRDLPDVVLALHGEFDFNVVIAILTARNGRVRTKVLNAPDAPVSKVVLNLAGGRKGLLENSENLCRRPQRANLRLLGQNGRIHKVAPKIKTSCKAKPSRKAQKRRR